MAFYLKGQTECCVCHGLVDENAIIFPSIVSNEKDPLRKYNDCFFHRHCLDTSLGTKILMILSDYQAMRPEPGKYYCYICSHKITNPDEMFPLGVLSSEEGSLLAPYNNQIVHASCLKSGQTSLKMRTDLKTQLHNGSLKFKELANLLLED